MRKQRAFRPSADQLEVREALSSIRIPAHFSHAPVTRVSAFNNPFANTLHLTVSSPGSLSFSRTFTRPATIPIRQVITVSPSTVSMTTTAVPGFISGLTFPGSVPGFISGLTFPGSVPGFISGLTFPGSVPGVISGLSFPNNIPE